jgi:hypothetical protein
MQEFETAGRRTHFQQTIRRLSLRQERIRASGAPRAIHLLTDPIEEVAQAASDSIVVTDTVPTKPERLRTAIRFIRKSGAAVFDEKLRYAITQQLKLTVFIIVLLAWEVPLLTVARITLGDDPIVREIYHDIEVGSALSAAALFVLHGIMGCWELVRRL